MIDCDIVIPVWNNLSVTKECIDSVLANTGIAFRIIVIDNGSEDETRRYLESLKEGLACEFSLIRNDENLGFVRAVNQGIRASDSNFICLLNNDTITTEGWLDEMVAVANSSKEIGLVNPSSNNLGQRPSSGEPVELYAERLGSRNAGLYVELGSAIGFCMLVKREVVEKIGLFDEIYGMGNFEDTDFSRRAVKEGYRCVRAMGAYVYHRESSSFARVKTFDEDFRRNREIFEFRWGRPRRVAYVLDGVDPNTLRSIEAESMKLARGGNWVWYFMRGELKAPNHSNIVPVGLPSRFFYLAAAFRILKKKKRYDEIFVGDLSFGKAMERLAFIHKARVSYY